MRNFSILKLSLLTFVLSSCSIGPSSLIRQHVYEGTQKPANELATIYGRWGGFSGEMLFMCNIDGKSYSQLGAISPCPSVVYLTPGKHEIEANWRWANRSEFKKITLNLEKGKTYEIVAKHKDIPLAKVEEVDIQIISKPEGYELSYKDLAPLFFEDGKVQNSLVDPATGKK